MKFPKLRAFFGLDDKEDVSAITDEQMTQAEGRIAQLEADKATADTRASTAEASLTTTKAELDKSKGQVATLEAWKKEQQAVDGRAEDDSNKLDDGQPGPKASWELEAEAAVARVKARLS